MLPSRLFGRYAGHRVANRVSSTLTVMPRSYVTKPVIVKKNKPTTNDSYTLTDEDIDKFTATQNTPENLSTEVDSILKSAGIDLDQLSSTPDVDALVSNTMELEEDPDAYESDFEFEGLENYGKPNFNFPPGSFLSVVALMLEATPNGVDMFPNHMRVALLEKVASTTKQALKRNPHMSQGDIFELVQQTFIRYGPDLAHTHDQALNILFPFAPRTGDIADLPNITGKAIVSQREYIDNRDNEDLPLDERVQMMVITYECLDPSLMGQNIRSVHEFDMDVYKLMMAGDSDGLEHLMHERGLIDKFTGKVLSDKFDQEKYNIASREDGNELLGQGPGSGMLKFTMLANAPTRLEISGSSNTGTGKDLVKRNSFGEALSEMAVDQIIDSEEALQRGVKVKEYKRQMVLSGADARKYQEQEARKASLQYAQEHQTGPTEAQLQAAAKVQAQKAAQQQQQQQQQGQAQQPPQPQPSSRYTASVDATPTPSVLRSFGDMKKEEKLVEQSMHSEIVSNTKPSTYAQKREEAVRTKASVPQYDTFDSSARETVRKQALDNLRQEELDNPTQDNVIDIYTPEDEELAEERAELQLLQQLTEEGILNYERLPEDMKKKYKNIIVKEGIGAGLPDPLLIEPGEDLLYIYPDANIMLMDALAAQWDDKLVEFSQTNDSETPDDPKEIRYRIMASVASGGKYAFSTEFLQSLFNRMKTLAPERAQPPSSTPDQSGTAAADTNTTYGSPSSNVGMNSIPSMDMLVKEINEVDPLDEHGAPIFHPNGAKLTREEKKQAMLNKIERLFGKKIVPLEDAEHIDPEFRQEVKAYYAMRKEKMEQHQKQQNRRR